jgi:polyphosphate kinase 2 (PPK2 family)
LHSQRVSGVHGQIPGLEQALVDSGVHLIKLWFSVSRAEQRTRFTIRVLDLLRQWKLSPVDLAALDQWDNYTQAKEAMFQGTDTPAAPWTKFQIVRVFGRALG